jgi:hypothetical protein
MYERENARTHAHTHTEDNTKTDHRDTGCMNVNTFEHAHYEVPSQATAVNVMNLGVLMQWRV